MKKIISLLIFTCMVHTGYSQEDSKELSEAFQLIEVWLEAQKDFEDLPGLSASMVDDQEIIWKSSFGNSNLEEGVETSTSTLYSICSISKLFTAVAIMKLYDEGKVRLDDKVSDILPWYNLEQNFPESGPITVRSVLTHSSGLPREANFPYWTGPDFPFPAQQEIREELGKQKTLYPSSTYFQYSNLGLTLLGEIVEEVSGMPYDEYVEKNILQPLRLASTRTELPENLYGQELAIGYSAKQRKGNREKVNFFQANGITAAAGFSSNVEDLANFASWQFRLLDTTTTEILKPSTLKNMHNVHWMDPDWNTSWGLGFAVWKGPDGNKWVSHGGSCPGYRSVLQINPEKKKAYVVMINAGGENPSKYARGMYEIMKKYQSEEKPKSEDKDLNLEEYRGFFNPQPWSSEVYITPWKGKLASLYLPSDSPAEALTFYKHIEGDTFRRVRDNGELGETLTFERDEDGNIVRFERHGNYSSKMTR